MSAKTLFLICSAVALTAVTIAQAEDRDHRGDQRSEARQDHGARPDDRARGNGRRDEHVWSHQSPRSQYRVGHMPPAFRHEERGFRPSERHIWIPGFWNWRIGFNDWMWVDGYWGLPPYDGYVYVQPRYVYSGNEVVYVDGGWCEPSYARDDGAAAGAVIGGVLGGVIGHQSHNTGVGVVAGAIVGSVIGHEADQAGADQHAAAAQDREAQMVAVNARANADANLEREKLIAQGQTVTDQDLAAAQERARVAKEKLAAAKAAREAALGRAAALEKANAEAAAAEAELNAMGR